MDTLAGALNVESSLLMVFDENEEFLYTKSAFGFATDYFKNLIIKKGEGVIGLAAEKGKLVSASRTANEQRFNTELKKGIANRCIICSPLIFQDKVMGVLTAEDKLSEELTFKKDERILIENLAAQLAIAIQNAKLNEDAEKTYVETITALALAVEAKDPYSLGHSQRVKKYVTRMAEAFKLDDKSTKDIADAAVLHDIGKIGVRDEILFKKSPLNISETAEMHKHAIVGENILKPIRSLQNVCYLVRHHQEKENGEGYPDGLQGKDMRLPLKILIVADAYDAMTSNRPYRRAMNKKAALKELERYAGIYYDRKVVEVFKQVI
jgi:HD-GYP domain-containing protein (c-di-GMP phosphodiesterase class II)